MRQGYRPGREKPRRDLETEQGAAETPGQGKGGAVTLAPRLLGAPQRRDWALVTLGGLRAVPHPPTGRSSASPSDSRPARFVHQIDCWRQVRPVGSGGLWSQAARPPGKPQTGPRPLPTPTLLPQPMPLMNWGLVHKTTACRHQTVWLQGRASGGCTAGAVPQPPSAPPPGQAGLGSHAGPCPVCSRLRAKSGLQWRPLRTPSRQQGPVHVASCSQTQVGRWALGFPGGPACLRPGLREEGDRGQEGSWPRLTERTRWRWGGAQLTDARF